MIYTRSKNKILVSIILLLLLVNILIAGYFLFFCKKPNPDQPAEGFTDLLEKKVGFNKQQIDRFNELKKGHWAEAKSGIDKIVQMKNQIFDLTRESGTPDSVIEKLADSIGNVQQKVEINFYHHVMGTRNICTASQQPAYDSLMKKIINKKHTYRKP